MPIVEYKNNIVHVDEKFNCRIVASEQQVTSCNYNCIRISSLIPNIQGSDRDIRVDGTMAVLSEEECRGIDDIVLTDQDIDRKFRIFDNNYCDSYDSYCAKVSCHDHEKLLWKIDLQDLCVSAELFKSGLYVFSLDILYVINFKGQITGKYHLTEKEGEIKVEKIE
jgi:hypothetical protein